LSGSRESIRKQIGKRWAELKTQVALVPASRMDESGVVGPWSVKDIVGHITTWERATMQAISGYLPGQDIAALAWPDEDIDGFNMRTVEETKPTSLDELMADLDNIHNELLVFLDGLPDDALSVDDVVTRIRVGTFDHYGEHTASIRQWLVAGQPS